ncbi:DUF6263 family protein [Sediminicola luteus]|uniref:Uncharacterized protein n=1 Tax=Sediminicola luteus TaxID=319238 RepID=A0A2A4G3A8_9FLAO|nr:DUF6263 family protein [Sediminicola luteus]PCE62446.1 hypothetical protein B7P33_19025 [Sediminicola luteus]
MSGQDSLGYSPENGQVFLIEQSVVQSFDQQIGETQNHIDTETGGLMEFKVIMVTDSLLSFQTTFKQLYLKIAIGEQTLLDIDTMSFGESDPQLEMFRCVLDKPIQVEMATNGKIVKVSNEHDFISEMIAVSGLTDNEVKSKLSESLGEKFGAEALARSFEQFTFIYPDRAVAIGDQWETHITGKANIENQWVYTAKDGENISIQGEGVAHMDLTEGTGKVELDGTQTVHVKCCPKSGFIKNMTIEGDFEGHSSIPELGEEEFPTAMHQTIVYKLIQ